MKRIMILSLLIEYTVCVVAQVQSVHEEILANPCLSAGTFLAYPAPEQAEQTPPPGEKKPFFLSHYGCQGSYYHEKPEFNKTPYQIFATADSLGKLTSLGQDVLHRLDILYKDAYNRSGEVSEIGAQQQRDIVCRMEERCPETFDKSGYASGRSAAINRCIMSMEEAMIQIARMRPTTLTHKSSHRYQSILNPQDKKLRAMKMDSIVQERYKTFAAKYNHPERLMKQLFNDSAYVNQQIQATELSDQLFNIAGNIQNTDLHDSLSLYDIFTPEEIYQHWKKQNAWWYINYGGYTDNGGTQPYIARNPLRYIIEKGDSVSHMRKPVAHLRFSMETTFLPLVCLMDVNGYGLATNDLESLDEKGWANYRIAPMSGNLQLIYYRKDYNDDDILLKVLLNEREATLPIDSDCAPYYHWRDVRKFYLDKLNAYEE